MKLNLDYYKSDLLYDQTISEEEEQKIINYINTYNTDDYKNIFENDIDSSVVSALSNNADNAINWYDFSKNSSALQINANFGEITGTLCDKVSKVVVIESNKVRAEAVAKRYNEKENLEIFCANIQDVQINDKFDYVILYGCLENASILLNNKKSDKISGEELIKIAKNYLNENGHILLFTNNKFAAKKFTGAIDNVNEKPYDSITGKTSLYSKFEIEDMLYKLELNNYKFYYMLPDYKLTNVIFSDDYLPKSNDTKIIYNKYCNERSIFAFDEIALLREILKSNNFAFFCNSFLVDISLSDKKLNNPKFISFNNMRDEKFRAITKIYDDFVIKEPKSSKSIEHIMQIGKNIELLRNYKFNIIDEFKENKIYSKFMNYKTYDKMLLESAYNGGKMDLYNYVSIWYEYIKEKLKPVKYNETYKENIFKINNIEVDQNLLNDMQFIKDGFLDLVFENTFYVENEFVFYDQEWYYENIPVEFILYRAINNLYAYNQQLEKIAPLKETYEYFGILKYLEVFLAFEKVFQDYVVDKNIRNFYGSVYGRNLENYIFNVKENVANDLNKYKKEVEDLKSVNQNYINEINKLNEELNAIYNSRTWKYTKIFRNDKTGGRA